MKRTLSLIFTALSLLLFPGVAFAGEPVIDLGEIKMPSVNVARIIPSFDETGRFMLTAELNYPKELEHAGVDTRIQWKIDGEAQGWNLRPDGKNRAEVGIGTPGTNVSIQACILRGSVESGCKTIKLTAAHVKELLNEKMWREITPRDWTEPAYVCQVMNNEEKLYVFYKVGSDVNTVTGEYIRNNVDLSLKVPGGRLSVKRWYQGGRWQWEHIRHNLTILRGSDGSIKSIKKGDVIYASSSIGKDVFVNGTYRIIRDSDGFRWEDKEGRWKKYNDEGAIIDFGNRYGVIGRYHYRNRMVVYISDRNNKPVFWFDYDDEEMLITAYDRNDRWIEYTYRKGRLSSVRGLLGSTTRYEYDPKGRLKAIIEAPKKSTFINYDAQGKVSSVLDADGNRVSFRYDYDDTKKLYYVRTEKTSGYVREVWFNKEGSARQVSINGRKALKIDREGPNLWVTDSRGNSIHKTFDHKENLIRVVYPDGTSESYEYGSKFSRRRKAINEKGIVTEYDYDQKGSMIRKVEAAGSPAERITEYEYDGNGNRLTIRVKGDENAPEAVTRMTYDIRGNITSMTDPEGNTTAFTYDYMGNVLTKKNARGKVWRYAYDKTGRLKALEDPLGNVTWLRHDETGNKIEEVDAEGRNRTFAYDSNNNLVCSTDTAGHTTLFEYNPEGRLTMRKDPEGKMLRYEYDPSGRLTRTIDGNGNEIIIEYDEPSTPDCPNCPGFGTNRPARIKCPTFTREFIYDTRGRRIEERDLVSGFESYVTRYEYDAVGNLISKTDREGKTTRYEYDALDRLIRVIDPLGKRTDYIYDDRDNLIAVKDANKNRTLFEYDLADRLLKEIRPMGQVTTYQYDGTGNLIEEIDAKGQRKKYLYDDAGRLIQIKYHEPGDNVAPLNAVAFSYDKVGNLRSYDDGTTSATYDYDDAYRKISETLDYGPFSKTYTYVYYKNGLKNSATGPDGIEYGYTYDANNQLKGVMIPNLGIMTYTSYQWNRPIGMSLPGGTIKQYAYDNLMRFSSIRVRNPDKTTLMHYQYAYDRMNNILKKTTEHGDYVYAYDALYRLTGAVNPLLVNEAFTYDPVGNRLTSSGIPGKWKYNANNELLRYADISFEYDANGNTTEKSGSNQITKFIYNGDNRLIRIEEGSGSLIAEYYYDPFGRRLWKEVGGKRTYFFYSDEGLVGEYDTDGEEIRTYGFKPGSTWTTDPLFIKQNEQYYFCHNDHLGTPQIITTPKGKVVWGARYSAFGVMKIPDDHKTANNLRFPGQYYDNEFDLNYNYHRLYCPTTGRYLNEDLLRSSVMRFYRRTYSNALLQFSTTYTSTNEIQSLLGAYLISRLFSYCPALLNPYIYTGNNPISTADPLGLFFSIKIPDEALQFIVTGAALVETGSAVAGAGIATVEIAGPLSLIPISVGVVQIGIGFRSMWEGFKDVDVNIDRDAISAFIDSLRPLEGFENIDGCGYEYY